MTTSDGKLPVDNLVTKDGYKIDDLAKFLDKLKGFRPKYVNNSVKDVVMLDAQCSDCPDIVIEEVKKLWRDYGLGNDHYICKVTLDEDLFEEYPNIYFWMIHKDIEIGEEFIIHWWW